MIKFKDFDPTSPFLSHYISLKKESKRNVSQSYRKDIKEKLILIREYFAVLVNYSLGQKYPKLWISYFDIVLSEQVLDILSTMEKPKFDDIFTTALHLDIDEEAKLVSIKINEKLLSEVES